MANISFELSFNNGPDGYVAIPGYFSVQRIIRGREEISSLYAYELLVEPTSSAYQASDTRCLLDSHICLRVKYGDTIIQSICGSIMSIEACSFKDLPNTPTTDTAGTNTKVYYKWTIRPSLARACYSLNRQSWISDMSEYDTLGEHVLRTLAERWSTELEFTTKARAALPKNLLQLRQNDESDYNFFARLLFTWGLGYIWDMSGNKEKLYIFDASSEENFQNHQKTDIRGGESSSALMDRSDADSSSFWRTSYGTLKPDDIHLQNYYHDDKTLSNVMLHDETWDQFSSFSAADAQAHETRLISRYRSAHDSALSALGTFSVSSNRSADSNIAVEASTIRLGRKISWKKSVSLCDQDDQFLITGLSISAANQEWKAEIRGRQPLKTLGIGILPCPVRLNLSSRPGEEDLIADEPWSEPRMRFFMAVVHDEDLLTAEAMQGRNLCCVRELLPEGRSLYGWVEMASPHADANSGIFARPRKGNVLICLDRGDLSIPIALGAMFRHSNAAPFAQLKQLDREKREDLPDTLLDSGALTLRSRKHDSHESNSNCDIDESESQDVTRPLSVHQLAEKPLNFSQIQLVSQTHGIKPVTQPKGIDDKYLTAAAKETALGATSGMSNDAAFTEVAALTAMQTEWNRPITRPHFEGISMYSSSDFLLQSADHQLINAGGEIVLTSAQAITLRVGTSCIKLTQSGIEISCKTGIVHNPGAYPAYHTGPVWDDNKEEILRLGSAQEINTMGGALSIGGKICVSFGGVNTMGPYITNAALTSFSATTLLGSSMTLSDFGASIFAPKTTIIGGATLVDTISNIGQSIMNGVDDRMSYQIGDNGGDPFDEVLQDGRRKQSPNFSVDGWDRTAQVLTAAASYWEFISTKGEKITNLFRMKGSMVKLEPKTLTFTGDDVMARGMSLTVGSCAIAPFAAIGERSNISAAPSDGSLFEQISYWGDQAASVAGDLTTLGSSIKRVSEASEKKGKEKTKEQWVGALGIVTSIVNIAVRVIAIVANKAVLKGSSLSKANYKITRQEEQELAKQTTVAKYSDAALKWVQKILSKKKQVAKDSTDAVQTEEQNVQQQDRAIEGKQEGVQRQITWVNGTSTSASQSETSATSTTSGALGTNSTAAKINN